MLKAVRAAVFVMLFPLTSILLPLTSLHAEDVRLSTYYPSPFGNYRQIQIQEANNADPTGTLIQAGIDIITDFNVGAFTPGVFWSTQDNSPLLPKAGIWMQINAAGTGSLLYFGTSNTFGVGGGITNNGLVLDQNGNLGVGIVTPQARIHVVADNGTLAAVTDILELNHSSTGTPAANFGTGLLFTGETTTAANTRQPMARIQSTWTTPADATRASDLQLQTTSTTAGVTTTTTKMTIEGLGNVGIGTTTPGQRLSVEGTLGILELDGPFHTIFQGGDQAANITYTLPTAQGAANTVLTNAGNAAGTLTWVAPPGGPRFIAPVEIFNSRAARNWIATTAAQVAGIPAGSTAVILDYQAAVRMGPGVFNTFIRIRSNAAAPAYILFRAYRNDHELGWGGQGVFPIAADRTFQFQVWPQGFDDYTTANSAIPGCIIRIIGFY